MFNWRLNLTIITLILFNHSGHTATLEQAERARACNVPETAVLQSLEKEPLIASIPSTLATATRGEGAIRIIEFFDYNCPVCRKFAPIWVTAEKEIKAIRVDHVELGVFGKGSKKAAEIGLAILQDSPEVYATYHDALMLTPGRVTNKKVNKVLADLQIDTEAIKARAKTADIRALRKANEEYLVSLGVSATPGLIVDGIILPIDENINATFNCVQKAARAALEEATDAAGAASDNIPSP